jgi:hypothetical protein
MHLLESPSFPLPALIALGLIAPGAQASATSEPPAASVSGDFADSDWSNLDRVMAELTAEGQGLNGDDRRPLAVSGFLRTNFAYSEDVSPPGMPGKDMAGFNLDAARIELSGRTAGMDAFVSADAFTGTMILLDAMVTVHPTDMVSIVAGQFRLPLLRTGLLRFSDTLFISRTRNGIFASLRDRGAMVQVDEGVFHGQLAIHNGADTVGSDHQVTGRITLDVAGEGVQEREGAYGAPQELAATIGVSGTDDQGLDNGEIVAFEAAMTMGPISFQGEYLNYGRTYDLDVLGIPIPGSRSDTNPYSLTASAMVVPDRVELALRFDDFEDNLGRELLTAGANYYFEGHAAKLQLNFTHLDSLGGDEQILALGATVAF